MQFGEQIGERPEWMLGDQTEGDLGERWNHGCLSWIMGGRWKNVDIFEICLEDKTNGTFGRENATVAEWMQ